MRYTEPAERIHKPAHARGQWGGDPARSDRPIGITILAVLNFMGVGLYLVALLLSIIALQTTEPQITRTNIAFDDMLRRLHEEHVSAQISRLIFISLVGMPHGVAVSIGLWRLRPWGRILAIFLYGASAILLLLANLATPLTGASLIGILVSAGAFIYLIRPEVGAAFEDNDPL
jgi:hypothetical protein